MCWLRVAIVLVAADAVALVVAALVVGVALFVVVDEQDQQSLPSPMTSRLQQESAAGLSNAWEQTP